MATSPTYSLEEALKELDKAPKVNIKGKKYATVATRVTIFRRHFRNHALTGIITLQNGHVRCKAEIADEKGRVVATGHAEEVRGSTNINKTSAVENCETSAVGRALAFLGLAGSEIASANEMAGITANPAVVQPIRAKQESII